MKKKLWITALFLICVLTAFFMRTLHYNQAVYQLGKVIGDVPETELTEPGFLPQYHKNFSPFTIESGMMFAYAQDVATGKGVPERDELLNGIEHIPPYGQMNMALEWFLGWGWKVKNAVAPDPEPSKNELKYQDHPRMAQWMSGQLRFWASLTSGLIFLWLIVMGCPKFFALLGGLLHAVSPAAIARSTGQDIVRGEFCIPLIIGAILLLYSTAKTPRLWKYILLFIITALAFAAWDLCQMLFGTFAVYEILRFVLGRRMTKPRLYAWCAIAGGIVFNIAFVPFNQVYSLWRSQTVWTALPVLFLAFAAYWLCPKLKQVFWRRLAAAIGAFLVFHLIWSSFINTPEYASNYSHFSEAMNAKITHWNVKPTDPEQLSYDARLLWTPSMTSTTWESAGTFFPGLKSFEHKNRVVAFFAGYLPCSLFLFSILLAGTFLFSAVKKEVKRHSESTLLPILYTIGFLVGFIYIIRYHEFLIIFLSMALALLSRDYWNALRPRGDGNVILYQHGIAKVWRFLPVVFMTLLLIYETVNSCSMKRRYTGDVAMKETADLIAWMRSEPEKFKRKGVVANMTICPMLRAYAGTGVVINPQFGIKVIRDATEEFLKTLYHGTEAEMADYCRRRNATFIVMQMVNPDKTPEILQLEKINLKQTPQNEQLKAVKTAEWVYSNRYIANAKEIPPNAVYRKFYTGKGLTQFRQVLPPDELKDLTKAYTVWELIER